jgi:DNA-binding transcriptional MerR regulator
MAASAAAPQIQKDFYRIGEVARMTDLKPFVLRYWETEFPMLEPVKSASGHRLYRAEDVNMVLRIKRLLYDEGFTIAGARRHLRDPQPASDTHPADFHLTSPDDADADLHGELRSEHRGEFRGERGGEFRGAEHRGSESHSGYRGDAPPPLLNRKMLLDLRDSLRAFLTLLERR